MIKIEKGIPFKSNENDLPFEKMKVGDSFLVPNNILYTTVRVRANQYSKNKKTKFSVKKTPDGYRCWRIK